MLLSEHYRGLDRLVSRMLSKQVLLRTRDLHLGTATPSLMYLKQIRQLG